MSGKLIVSSSPHVGSKLTTQTIMLHVIIALAFPLVAGVVLYGLYSLLVVLLSVIAAVLAEMLFNLIRKKPQTVSDLSAVVTGMILGLNLPPTIPLYVPVVGSIFAIMIVKMLFGGLGKNFANPAATARVFLLLSWAGPMTRFIAPVDYAALGGKAFLTGLGVDAVTTATPLGAIKNAGLQGIALSDVNLLDLFLGRIGGSIGEVCALAILLGGIYLIVMKIIDFKIPLIYLAASAISALIFYKSGWTYVLPTLLSGGLLFAAFYMLTDYASSPDTFWGTVIYAAGAGLMTVIIRRYGGYNEGASIAILLMNMLTPLLDKITVPRPFGYRKPARAKKEGSK
ncbi:MAG TPA: RnfABCDGE type electron transport complex subunit D [Candidatus Stercoripulliclostridium merdipullorum]|uniref:Ion-translocating oxidoreductase complex subunit D n=1 Tax=Candidatus Stercoripulliclostridium merdipullorum TaxID=2840952 RepID=A0A9D1NAZ4_9FIRM|nr:RnfABCDGE type electron transport complex subunit D [Candidatus Stercoripulliclostridium merdipullorum]